MEMSFFFGHVKHRDENSIVKSQSNGGGKGR